MCGVIKIAKIFIIDDDVDIVLLFEQFLDIKGHEIVAKAYNGEEAIKIFENLQTKPDIILMDHRMPVKNGLETLKEMLIINPEIKIIFVSADYTIRNKAIETGAIDFLEKPVDFSALFAMVKKYTIIRSEIN